jgi:SAM-dependent methyltransferase
MKEEKFSFYKEYPKTCREDDFWGQVKRTIRGVPVSDDQIEMIVDAVVDGLQLQRDDNLLDLCCGNGALSTLMFEYCKTGYGVDFSEYLISIANKNFASHSQTFICQDVMNFCMSTPRPERFTKAVCYGSFAFLEQAGATEVLKLLRRRFTNVKRIFIGNCPDKKSLHDFFDGKDYTDGIEDDPDSPIGIWRTEAEFISLAERCGWRAEFRKMPTHYYAAHYRYDVVLTYV